MKAINNLFKISSIHYDYNKHSKTQNSACYIGHFIAGNQLLKADSLFYIEGETIGSPMGGNIAAFINADSAKFYAGKFNAILTSWADLSN